MSSLSLERDSLKRLLPGHEKADSGEPPIKKQNIEDSVSSAQETIRTLGNTVQITEKELTNKVKELEQKIITSSDDIEVPTKEPVSSSSEQVFNRAINRDKQMT